MFQPHNRESFFFRGVCGSIEDDKEKSNIAIKTPLQHPSILKKKNNVTKNRNAGTLILICVIDKLQADDVLLRSNPSVAYSRGYHFRDVSLFGASQEDPDNTITDCISAVFFIERSPSAGVILHLEGRRIGVLEICVL